MTFLRSNTPFYMTPYFVNLRVFKGKALFSFYWQRESGHIWTPSFQVWLNDNSMLCALLLARDGKGVADNSAQTKTLVLLATRYPSYSSNYNKSKEYFLQLSWHIIIMIIHTYTNNNVPLNLSSYGIRIET